jgi:hypothetical protein
VLKTEAVPAHESVWLSSQVMVSSCCEGDAALGTTHSGAGGWSRRQVWPDQGPSRRHSVTSMLTVWAHDTSIGTVASVALRAAREVLRTSARGSKRSGTSPHGTQQLRRVPYAPAREFHSPWKTSSMRQGQMLPGAEHTIEGLVPTGRPLRGQPCTTNVSLATAREVGQRRTVANSAHSCECELKVQPGAQAS